MLRGVRDSLVLAYVRFLLFSCLFLCFSFIALSVLCLMSFVFYGVLLFVFPSMSVPGFQNKSNSTIPIFPKLVCFIKCVHIVLIGLTVFP